MEPCGFEGETAVLNAPPGMEAECTPLSIARVVDLATSLPIVVSCWKVTQDELDEINRTGRVWLMLWGVTMPPAYVSGLRPDLPAAKSE